MACPSCAAIADGKPMPPPWRNPQVITSALSGLLLASAFFGAQLGLPLLSATGLYILAILVGGWFFGREALEELIKDHEIGIELLMSVAAITAGLMGQWAEAALLVFLYSISEAAEGYTEARTRNAIRALMDLAPRTALVQRDAQEFRIPVEALEVGDIFIVYPGESVATDGEIISGCSSLNEAPVTGESIPVEKTVGDIVYAATINDEGALSIRATKTTADNILARIIQMVDEAQANKGRSQRFIERFGHRYSPAVLAIGILLTVIPGLLGMGWEEWLSRATVFIVAAAPCALVISIPITLVAAIGTAGRSGLLIKGGVHLENLAKIQVVALDKTGTLTTGRPVVTNIIALNGYSEADVLTAAASLELRSQHPLARAILKQSATSGLQVQAPEDFTSLTGAGARGRINNETVYIGSPELFSHFNTSLDDFQSRIESMQREAKTVVLVGTENIVYGLIAIADPLRPQARECIAELRRAGIKKLIMLSGDNYLTAQAIARQAGIDELYAELKPEDKTLKIASLDKKYGRVAMVGDGINDAPALAAAHVGIAMGAAGTDVALETADVALMADDLSRLPYLIRFSHRNWKVIRQNLALSTVVISILITGAVTGSFSLPIAVIAHEVSEFVVIASGLRMLKA